MGAVVAGPTRTVGGSVCRDGPSRARPSPVDHRVRVLGGPSEGPPVRHTSSVVVPDPVPPVVHPRRTGREPCPTVSTPTGPRAPEALSVGVTTPSELSHTGDPVVVRRPLRPGPVVDVFPDHPPAVGRPPQVDPGARGPHDRLTSGRTVRTTGPPTYPSIHPIVLSGSLTKRPQTDRN